MKKNILICFCLLIALASNAQVITIPDSLFRAAALLYCDENRDGVITVEEANKATRISIGEYPKKVKSLEGIEFFINLQEISIGEVETDVDVSKNLKLQKINIIWAGLKKITLGKLQNLEILWIDGNELTDVDFSECPNLRNLNVGRNKFTTLNLSQNVNLQTLSCMNNQLQSLDIRACVKMHSGYSKYMIGQPREGLSCENNPNLKVICIPEERLQNYWFKDEQAVFSTTCEPAGIASAKKLNQLSLYPNPASDVVHINTPLAIGGILTITNALGQQVLQQPIVAEATECNVAQLPKGVYSVAMRHSNGNLVGQSKLVVQ